MCVSSKLGNLDFILVPWLTNMRTLCIIKECKNRKPKEIIPLLKSILRRGPSFYRYFHSSLPVTFFLAFLHCCKRFITVGNCKPTSPKRAERSGNWERRRRSSSSAAAKNRAFYSSLLPAWGDITELFTTFSAVAILSRIIEAQNDKKSAYRISSLAVLAYCDYIKTAITEVASVVSLQIAERIEHWQWLKNIIWIAAEPLIQKGINKNNGDVLINHLLF